MVRTAGQCRRPPLVHTVAANERCMSLADLTLATGWGQAEQVRELIPDNVVTIAAGGIGSSEQAARYSALGFDAVCLGRSLAMHPSPDKLVGNIRKFEGPPAIPGVNGMVDP